MNYTLSQIWTQGDKAFASSHVSPVIGSLSQIFQETQKTKISEFSE